MFCVARSSQELPAPMTCRIIGMIIFPRLTQLDMTGPHEVTSHNI
jgi:hypothetical protein